MMATLRRSLRFIIRRNSVCEETAKEPRCRRGPTGQRILIIGFTGPARTGEVRRGAGTGGLGKGGVAHGLLPDPPRARAGGGRGRHYGRRGSAAERDRPRPVRTPGGGTGAPGGASGLRGVQPAVAGEADGGGAAGELAGAGAAVATVRRPGSRRQAAQDDALPARPGWDGPGSGGPH